MFLLQEEQLSVRKNKISSTIWKAWEIHTVQSMGDTIQSSAKALDGMLSMVLAPYLKAGENPEINDDMGLELQGN